MEVTREWRETIKHARGHGQMSEMLRYHELPGVLADLMRGLEGVEKSVKEFLEEKRGNFPRFYFLANNEMVRRSSDKSGIRGQCCLLPMTVTHASPSRPLPLSFPFSLSLLLQVDMLVRSHDPATVQPYLHRCFPGIKRVALSQVGVKARDGVEKFEGQ
jgi:hypothetical protein